MTDPSDASAEMANLDVSEKSKFRSGNVRTSRLASAPNLTGFPTSPMGYKGGPNDGPLGRSLSISAPDQHIDAEDFRLHAVRRFAIDKSKERQAIKQVRRRIAGSMPNIHVNQHLEGDTDHHGQTVDTVKELLDDLAEDHPDSHIALDHLQWVCDQLGLQDKHSTKRNSVAFPRAQTITEGSEEEEEEELSLEDMQQDMIQDADIPSAEVV